MKDYSGLAQSSLNLLDNDTSAWVFGSVIDQAKLNIEELRQEYEQRLQEKYGESLEFVLARIVTPYYPAAVTQLVIELAQSEAQLRRAAEVEARDATTRATQTERNYNNLKSIA